MGQFGFFTIMLFVFGTIIVHSECRQQSDSGVEKQEFSIEDGTLDPDQNENTITSKFRRDVPKAVTDAHKREMEAERARQERIRAERPRTGLAARLNQIVRDRERAREQQPRTPPRN